MMADTAGAPLATDGLHTWLGLDVRAAAIPQALHHIAQWVLWRAEPRPDGKVAKVPYQANGKKASSINPATWSELDILLRALDEEGHDYSGVGFCVHAQNGILVLDFDHVRNGQTGEILPAVLGAVRYLDTYAEVSPSGTGVRVIGYGALERALTSRVLQGWVTGRFVTITGHHLPDTPTDLKPIAPEKLAEVASWFADRPAIPNTQSPAPPGQLIDAQRCLEIRQALGYIHPDETYDVWLKVGMALHSTGAPNAFGLWNEWSLTGPKYDAKAVRAKWVSFTTNRLNGVELSAIFALAQARGWVNPASRQALEFERIAGMTIDEANRRVPEPHLAPEVLPRALAFPVDGLDEIASWVSSLASVVHPAITQQAVLALASAAVSRLYVTPPGDPLSLYLGCCGRSVGELRYVQHAVSAALAAAGLRRILRGTRMTSPASIYKSLLRAPAMLYLSDDYGGVAAFSKRQPSGLQEHALSIIASLYDGKTIQLDGPEDAGLRPGTGQTSDEQPVIYAPCLSVLALISADQLAILMRQSETGRGALQQMLLCVADERVALEQDPKSRPSPAWLPDALRRLRRVAHPGHAVDLSLADIFSAASGLPPHQVVIPFEAPVEPAYDALDALSGDRRTRSLLLAARTIVRRIAAVLAAWQSPDHPVVTRQILDWAVAYVCERLRETLEQFEILHSDSADGRPSVYDQVLAKVTEARTAGLSNRDLARGCWGYRNLSAEKRGELMALMLDDEVIVEIASLDAHTKRRSKVYVAARFTAKG